MSQVHDERLLAEIARLREGDFTETEFQNLCHCIPEDEREKFFTGCADFQEKLFGVSDRQQFVSVLNDLFKLFTRDKLGRWCFNSLSRDGSELDKTMDRIAELLKCFYPLY